MQFFQKYINRHEKQVGLKFFLSAGLICAIPFLYLACQKKTESKAFEQKQSQPVVFQRQTLDQVIKGKWRTEDQPRDIYRHPKETLEFFGIKADMRVAEIWPGRGWYTQILAPWLDEGGGELIIVQPFDLSKVNEVGVNPKIKAFQNQFKARFGNQDLYGTYKTTSLTAFSKNIAEDNSLDAVLSFRNFHNWMAGRYAEKALKDFYKALKPGGVLGLVDHKSPKSHLHDPFAKSGYVQEDYVIKLAEEAGFKLVEKSDINSNPKDTADHPLGVWTLKPRRKSPEAGSDQEDGFDRSFYDQIGESNRMTLKFIKPMNKQEIKEKQD